MRPAKAMATARSGPAKLVLINPGNKVRQGTFCADHACYKCLGIGLICFGFVLLAFFCDFNLGCFPCSPNKGEVTDSLRKNSPPASGGQTKLIIIIIIISFLLLLLLLLIIIIIIIILLFLVILLLLLLLLLI